MTTAAHTRKEEQSTRDTLRNDFRAFSAMSHFFASGSISETMLIDLDYVDSTSFWHNSGRNSNTPLRESGIFNVGLISIPEAKTVTVPAVKNGLSYSLWESVGLPSSITFGPSTFPDSYVGIIELPRPVRLSPDWDCVTQECKVSVADQPELILHLNSRPHIQQMLKMACAEIRQSFGAIAELRLELTRDREVNNAYLALVISLPQYPETVLETIQQIRRNLRANAHWVRGYLHITTNFEPSSTSSEL